MAAARRRAALERGEGLPDRRSRRRRSPACDISCAKAGSPPRCRASPRCRAPAPELLERPARLGDADHRAHRARRTRTIDCSAGKIFLYARSPVAPKNTRASEGAHLGALPNRFRRTVHSPGDVSVSERGVQAFIGLGRALPGARPASSRVAASHPAPRAAATTSRAPVHPPRATRSDRSGGELESGAVREVGVAHGVLEPAGRAHHRRIGAAGQLHLVQSTRLIEGRHEEEVRGPLDQVSQRGSTR